MKKFVVDNNTPRSTGAEPLMVSRIRSLLDAMPPGRLITMRGLAGRLGCSVFTIWKYSADPRLSNHKTYAVLNRQRLVLFANQKTISDFKKEQGENGKRRD